LPWIILLEYLPTKHYRINTTLNLIYSEIVMEELEAVSEDKRKLLYAAVEGFTVLKVTDEIS